MSHLVQRPLLGGGLPLTSLPRGGPFQDVMGYVMVGLAGGEIHPRLCLACLC